VAARSRFQDVGDDYMAIRASRSLAPTLQGQRRHDAARAVLEEALSLAGSLGATIDAAEIGLLRESVQTT
jgi:hypothetical protein